MRGASEEPDAAGPGTPALATIFLTGYWREVDERGFRWHYALHLFVVPALLIVLISNHVLSNLRALPNWLLVVSFLTVDACILVMVLSAVTLRRRRKGDG